MLSFAQRPCLCILPTGPTCGKYTHLILFTSFIYSITWPFIVPFQAVFPRTIVEGSIFEWTTLLAMLVYWLISIAIIKLFLMSKTVSTPEAAVKLENQEL